LFEKEGEMVWEDNLNSWLQFSKGKTSERTEWEESEKWMFWTLDE
jgi:hypothetical protein